ncbi:MAG: type II toxin-antitoxin system PemK/MazF family toxin [Bacteroidales bacterium]|nr:type II toxin-antitoxin system PemK/MazF family toxin [Lentimicrobiaceae bacterium]MDD5695327.1 type II toxin-antitoxin system PemK/MazF family toxin [Bacteroidales bacterium]
MKQREIWISDLNPVKGSEQRGIRPVVIISGNAMNDHLGICIACPLSSVIKNYTGCTVLSKNETNGLDQDSEIITFQVRTIARERLIRKMGEITVEQLDRVVKGLNEILEY